MSSYDPNANRVWMPKKTTSTSNTSTSQGSDPRALVYHKNKSFTEYQHQAAYIHPRHGSWGRNQSIKRGSAESIHTAAGLSTSGPTSTQDTSQNIFKAPNSPINTTSQSQHIKIVPQKREEHIKKHRRSASETFRNEDFGNNQSSASVQPHTPPKRYSHNSFESKKPLTSTSPTHRSWGRSQHKHIKKNKTAMVDACTQTSDDEVVQDDYMVQAAAKLLLLTASQRSSKKNQRLSVKSISFNGKNTTDSMQTSPTEPGGPNKGPDELLTDLNDLEEEIALMRFKAMSIQEQMKWLAQEKEKRPNNPVSFMTSAVPSGTITVSPSLRKEDINNNKLKSPPVVSFSPISNPAETSKPTIEFDARPPGDDSILKPIKPAASAAQRALQVTSPDHTKRQDIFHPKSSAFSSSLIPPSLNKNTRLTKSLGSLPGIPPVSPSSSPNFARVIQQESPSKLGHS